MAKEMTCPKCGAQLSFSADKTSLSCSWCGYRELLTGEKSTEQKSYEYRMGILRAEEEADKRKKRRRRLVFISVAAVVVLFIGVCVAAVQLMKPEINPFDYIELSFTGADGEGKAELRVKSNEYFTKGTVDVTYDGRAFADDLSEGDKIVVKMKHSLDNVRFSPDTQTFTVKGLELFLSDLDKLSDKAIKAIHEKTESLNKKNIQPMLTGAEPDLKKAQPEKLMLLSDGAHNNILYDVYRAVFNTSKGEKTVYLAVYYKGMIVNDGDDPTFSYESAMYTGDIITLGAWYDGTLTAYETLKDAELAIKNNKDKNMKLTERKL